MTGNMASGKILILGAKGMLGSQLVEVFGDEAVGWDRQECDVLESEKLKTQIETLQPQIVINCAAYNDVDSAESHQKLAYKLNTQLPAQLAEICRRIGAVLVHFSTNYVFDGEQAEGYAEIDKPNPLSVYGKYKHEGEQAVLNSGSKFYLIRTASLFGPKGKSRHSKKSFIELMLDLSEKNQEVQAIEDEIESFTYVVDLARAIKLLLDQKPSHGIYHLINAERASWFDFAKEIFKIKKSGFAVLPVSAQNFRRVARRPKQAVLLNTKLPPLRPWQEALREFLIPNVP